MPRRRHGVHKCGMQSLMASMQQESPSGPLQRGSQALPIAPRPREATPGSDHGGVPTNTDPRRPVIRLRTLKQEAGPERQKQHETLNKHTHGTDTEASGPLVTWDPSVS